MRKTRFVFVVIGLLLFTSACASQSEPAPTVVCIDLSGYFETEKALTQFVQNSDESEGWLDPAAYLPCSRLFPGDIMRDASILHKNYLECTVYITEKAYMIYETDYDPSYSKVSFSDSITEVSFYKGIVVTNREESIVELNNTLRYSLDETLNSQVLLSAVRRLLITIVMENSSLSFFYTKIFT